MIWKSKGLPSTARALLRTRGFLNHSVTIGPSVLTDLEFQCGNYFHAGIFVMVAMGQNIYELSWRQFSIVIVTTLITLQTVSMVTVFMDQNMNYQIFPW